MLDLSVAEPSWTILPTRMKQGRHGCAAVVDYNRDIVVTGGYNEDDRDLNSVEVFDTHNQVWKATHSIPPMLTARSGHSLVALKNGRILAHWEDRPRRILRRHRWSCSCWKTMGMMYNGYPCHPWRSAVVALPLLQQPPRPHPEFSSWVAKTTIARHWTRAMGFVQEPLQDDLVYWSLLNPPPLEKPALATEGPTADTTIHKDTQSEEWIQDLERTRDRYHIQALRAIVDIYDWPSKPFPDTATRRATLPEERIKRLRCVLDKHLSDINKEIELVRQSSSFGRKNGLGGQSGPVQAKEAASVASPSDLSDETLPHQEDSPPNSATRKRKAAPAQETEAATQPVNILPMPTMVPVMMMMPMMMPTMFGPWNMPHLSTQTAMTRKKKSRKAACPPCCVSYARWRACSQRRGRPPHNTWCSNHSWNKNKQNP